MKKTALVVGASSDVGAAFIKRYAERYDTVIGTYNANSAPLDALREQLGEKLVARRLDLLDEKAIESFGQYLRENELLPGYVLYLPALQPQMVYAHQLESETLHGEVQVGAVAFLLLMKAILPDMAEKQFGRVCCMLSSVTEHAIPYQTAYIVSKYALLGAIKALAAEYAGKHITVNAVSPSMIDTKFSQDTTGFVRKKNISIQPLKRLATVEDVIRGMAFYLEDENEYITGENTLIAGGGIIS